MAKTAARNPGRPSDYLPEYVDQAAKLCRLGATDAKIADFFEKEWRAQTIRMCNLHLRRGALYLWRKSAAHPNALRLAMEGHR